MHGALWVMYKMALALGLALTPLGVLGDNAVQPRGNHGVQTHVFILPKVGVSELFAGRHAQKILLYTHRKQDMIQCTNRDKYIRV